MKDSFCREIPVSLLRHTPIDPISGDTTHPQFLTDRINCRVSGLAGRRLRAVAHRLGYKTHASVSKMLLEACAGIEADDFYDLLSVIRAKVVASGERAAVDYAKKTK